MEVISPRQGRRKVGMQLRRLGETAGFRRHWASLTPPPAQESRCSPRLPDRGSAILPLLDRGFKGPTESRREGAERGPCLGKGPPLSSPQKATVPKQTN